MARRDTKEKLKNQTPLLFENILEEGVGNFSSEDEENETSPENISRHSETVDVKESETEKPKEVDSDDSKKSEDKNELLKSNLSEKKQTPKNGNPILSPVNPIIKKDRIQRIFQVDGYISEKIDEMTRDKKNKLLPGAKGAISQMVNNGLIRELVALGVFPESYLEEKIKDYY